MAELVKAHVIGEQRLKSRLLCFWTQEDGKGRGAHGKRFKEMEDEVFEE